MGRVLIDTDVYLAYIFPPSKNVFSAVRRLLEDIECGEIYIAPHIIKETVRIAEKHGRKELTIQLFGEIGPCLTLLEYDQNTSIIAGKLLIENPKLSLPEALNIAIAVQYHLTIVSGKDVYEKLGVNRTSIVGI